MRKISAILLICCFALYQYGYYILFYSLDHQIEKNWSHQIFSENHTWGEEKLLEIPLTMPYLADEEDFKTTNFSFEKDGKLFRAIKQRYTNDTLQIVYTPDSSKINLNNTFKSWVELINNVEGNSEKNTSLAKTLTKDFNFSEIYQFQNLSLDYQIHENIGFIFLTYKDSLLIQESPPPEII